MLVHVKYVDGLKMAYVILTDAQQNSQPVAYVRTTAPHIFSTPTQRDAPSPPLHLKTKTDKTDHLYNAIDLLTGSFDDYQYRRPSVGTTTPTTFLGSDQWTAATLSLIRRLVAVHLLSKISE